MARSRGREDVDWSCCLGLVVAPHGSKLKGEADRTQTRASTFLGLVLVLLDNNQSLACATAITCIPSNSVSFALLEQRTHFLDTYYKTSSSPRTYQPYRSPAVRAIMSLAGPRRRVNACSPSVATRSFSEARTVAARVWRLRRASSVHVSSYPGMIADALTAKVVTRGHLADNGLAAVDRLDCLRRAALNQEELVSHVTVPDDVLAGLKRARLEDVGDLGTLSRLERRENRHGSEEGLVLAALA